MTQNNADAQQAVEDICGEVADVPTSSTPIDDGSAVREDSAHWRRHRTRAHLVILVVSCALALVTGATTALAGYAAAVTAFQSPPGAADFCVLHRPQFRKPSNNPPYEMDVNVWAYYRDNNLNGCFLSNATKNFTNPPAYSVQGAVYRWSDGTMCTTISLHTIPTSYTTYGVGKAYNRSGACSSTTVFGFTQVTYQGTTPRSYYWQFTY